LRYAAERSRSTSQSRVRTPPRPRRSLWTWPFCCFQGLLRRSWRFPPHNVLRPKGRCTACPMKHLLPRKPRRRWTAHATQRTMGDGAGQSGVRRGLSKESLPRGEGNSAFRERAGGRGGPVRWWAPRSLCFCDHLASAADLLAHNTPRAGRSWRVRVFCHHLLAVALRWSSRHPEPAEAAGLLLSGPDQRRRVAAEFLRGLHRGVSAQSPRALVPRDLCDVIDLDVSLPAGQAVFVPVPTSPRRFS
jgi:hypothetical protein